MRHKYLYRDLSWLDFNARVLQEAEDQDVPILERLRFVGIFSNNLDEFFQVRYATLKHISLSNDKDNHYIHGHSVTELLSQINQKVANLQQDSVRILEDIQKELIGHEIYFISETDATEKQTQFLNQYFFKKVNNRLTTLILTEELDQIVTDNNTFLAVKMYSLVAENNFQNVRYALVEIPKEVNRFVVLPREKGSEKKCIMLVDDVIRLNLGSIFFPFDYTHIEAHMIKVTRDAILDLDDDFSKSYADKIRESVQERIHAEPTRLVFDKNIADDTLKIIKKKLRINRFDSLIPSGRYHNRGDYLRFPSIGRKDLQYKPSEPLNVNGLSLERSLFKAIEKKDFLIYTPYQNFGYIIKLLTEAALDPYVRTIKITIYRMATISSVVKALINAARNGKKVIAQIELQARFDESNNISQAELLESAGVELLFGVPGLKVHSKICLIERKKDNKKRYYGFISTGNFNEDSAKVYTDCTLLTSHQGLLNDINDVFNFLQAPYFVRKYKHIIASPHYTKSMLRKLVKKEVKNHEKGLVARIRIKVNAVSNHQISDVLRSASKRGVKVDMIVRGICTLVPEVNKKHPPIEILSILDKWLEHSRIYIFENAGEPLVFISSGDLMTRNIENRVEVAVPIYDPDIKRQLIDTFDISWNDNRKARIINQEPQNRIRTNDRQSVRSQVAIYNYFKRRLEYSHKGEN